VRAAHESRSAADSPPQSEVGGEDHNDQYIHLQRSNLQRSNLQRATLQRSNLQRATLQRATLQRATHPHRRASMRVIIDWRTRARRISIPSGRK